MPGGRERVNRDIGENGRQPNDYAASYWDELKIINVRPVTGRPAGARVPHLLTANDRGNAPSITAATERHARP